MPPEGRLPAACLSDERPCRLLQRAAEEIHRRRADEAGNEHVGGPLVDGLRIGELLDHAVLHDRHLGAQRHRLDLVVRDVDDGGAAAGRAAA